MTKKAQAALRGLAIAITLAATSAQAAPERVSTSVTVVYTDLDLATPAGQRSLHHRIAQAARRVCGIEEATTGTRMTSVDASDCYQQALRNVRTHVADAMRRSQAG